MPGSGGVTRLDSRFWLRSSGSDGLVKSASTPLPQVHLSSLHLSGELQFSFVCFLLGTEYEAFEHRKRLLNILCRHRRAYRDSLSLSKYDFSTVSK